MSLVWERARAQACVRNAWAGEAWDGGCTTRELGCILLAGFIEKWAGDGDGGDAKEDGCRFMPIECP